MDYLFLDCNVCDDGLRHENSSASVKGPFYPIFFKGMCFEVS